MFGRQSYQLLNEHWPTAADQPGATPNEIHYSNWYNRVSKFVLSTTLSSTDSGTTIIGKDIFTKVTQLKQQEGGNILMFGGPTAVHSLLELDLVDEFWLLIHPVLFGSGLPLVQSTVKGYATSTRRYTSLLQRDDWPSLFGKEISIANDI